MLFLSCAQRSYLAQHRCGIFHIELDKRICKACKSYLIENEGRFIFHCNKYNNIRANVYRQICYKIPSFLNNNNHEKLKIHMEKSNVNSFGRFI